MDIVGCHSPGIGISWDLSVDFHGRVQRLGGQPRFRRSLMSLDSLGVHWDMRRC